MTMQQPKVVESSNSLGLATTSAQVLNERCFDFSPRKKARGANWGEGSTVTLSSDGCSDRGGDSPGPGNDVWGEKGGVGTPTPMFVGQAGEARQGRDNQRWDDGVRLVVGCVPIVKDGGILLCSSSKKKEWILPKGGWETDETLEEGAQRETYEEAGVYGVLGQALSPISYEPRKKNKGATSPVPFPVDAEGGEGTTSEAGNGTGTPSRSTATTPQTTPNSTRRCRATLFPMYVREVLSEWPERGRARKIVSIDEAIEIVTRNELRKALIQVRDEGLHLTGETVAGQQE